MNKQRRAALKEIADAIQEQKEKLAEICDQESDAFDNLPESIQESSRGEAMEDAIDVMDEALDDMDDLINRILELAEG